MTRGVEPSLFRFVNVGSTLHQTLHIRNVIAARCGIQRTSDDFTKYAELLAIDFVSWPIVALAFCIAIPSHPAFATKLHLGRISLEAVVACMRHVFRFSYYFAGVYWSSTHTAILLSLQLNEVAVLEDDSLHAGEFSIERCIVETMKPHQLRRLESSHLLHRLIDLIL